LETKTVEVLISPGEVIRVEGLQRDRRRRNELRITLPDGRVLLAYGRRPEEDGWEVVAKGGSNALGGDTLVSSIACFMGYDGFWLGGGPEWLQRLSDRLAER
jgi:hypothetical protein